MAIKVLLTDKSLFQNKVDALAFFVEKDFDFKKEFKEISEKYCKNLQKLLSDRKFTGKQGSFTVVPVSSDSTFTYLVFLGLGKDNNQTTHFESYRRTIGKLIKLLPSYNIKSVAFQLPQEKTLGFDINYIAKQTAMIISMADYAFDDFITENEQAKRNSYVINIIVPAKQIKDLQKDIDQGLIIAKAVNEAREWVNLPANMLTPADLAANARQIATDHSLKCTIFHEKEVNKMGMGGLSAVARGSDKDCCLVIMEYKCKEKDVPTLCFVGKGITFDSGGLSLKPAELMETMKEDMSGAAAVIACMQVLGQLKPKVNVIGVAPISENMPSGTSVKPGDIIRFYNGKTAEILNTDAEGRLILADALAYATKHYKPDFIIDIATLTGACARALGPFYTGLFTEHEELSTHIHHAAKKSGDFVWRLPLTNDYKPAVKGSFTDLRNTGRMGYMAGGTTAACFLQHFVNDIPWAHLDIAGTAFNVPDAVSYFSPATATGVGVRLLVELAMEWKK